MTPDWEGSTCGRLGALIGCGISGAKNLSEVNHTYLLTDRPTDRLLEVRTHKSRNFTDIGRVEESS
jgi:hypothetical protein